MLKTKEKKQEPKVGIEPEFAVCCVGVYSYKDEIENKDRATSLMQKRNNFDIVNRD
jgi:hypothetical protein